MKKHSILLVDDDKQVLQTLKLVLSHNFEPIVAVSNPNQIYYELQKKAFDLVLLDMNFSTGVNNGNEGLFWLQEIHKYSKTTQVVMITAYGDIQLAVTAIKKGAADFIIKPWDNHELIASLHAALQMQKARAYLKKSAVNEIKNTSSQEGIIAQSKQMQAIIQLVERVAPTDANILITGENGTGKEVIARMIHQHSKRTQMPFVPVDLGSLSPTLFESELFGHKKGAFTDAKSDKAGWFKTAHKGTLFLDEIGNLPLPLQAKLLTVLQTQEVLPLGSTKAEKTDIRIICATNCNLKQTIQSGMFREDLYFRMNTIEIELPPLRQRQEDICPLAYYYLNKITNQYNKGPFTLTTDAEAALKAYVWPGNIRELIHAIERAVILSDNQELKATDFLFLKSKNKPTAGLDAEWPLTFEEIEKKAIIRALENNNGVLIEAARELGITRQTIYNKIKKYNLSER